MNFLPHPTGLAIAARARHQDVPVGAGHVRWHQLGDGPPLVLLHGGHGSWLHWARNIEALSASHSVWVPDLPGYGASSAPAEPSLAALLAALQGSLDVLLGARTPVALAGFSFGGLVAARLARQRGAVSRLALFGPAGHGGPRRPRGELGAWRAAHEAGDAVALQALMRRNLELHMLAGPADDMAVRIHTEACLQTRFRSKRISLAGGLLDALMGLEAPLLLAWGEHDVTATPASLVPAMAAALPQARVLTIPGAGHWVPYEAADAVNALLLADSARVSSAAGPGLR